MGKKAKRKKKLALSDAEKALRTLLHGPRMQRATPGKPLVIQVPGEKEGTVRTFEVHADESVYERVVIQREDLRRVSEGPTLALVEKHLRGHVDAPRVAGEARAKSFNQRRAALRARIERHALQAPHQEA